MEKGHGLRKFLDADDLPRCRFVSRVAQVERTVGEKRAERRDSYLRLATRTAFRVYGRQPMAITIGGRIPGSSDLSGVWDRHV
jgi:hypothetical protein